MTFQTYITDVESLTLRDVAGEGSQMVALVRTKGGTLTLRLIAKRGAVIRVTDLRHRDKKKRRERFVSVPMTDVFPESGKHGHR